MGHEALLGGEESVKRHLVEVVMGLFRDAEGKTVAPDGLGVAPGKPGFDDALRDANALQTGTSKIELVTDDCTTRTKVAGTAALTLSGSAGTCTATAVTATAGDTSGHTVSCVE